MLLGVDIAEFNVVIVAVTRRVGFSVERTLVEQFGNLLETVRFTDTCTTSRYHEPLLLVIEELQILAVQVVHDLNGRFVIGVLFLHRIDEAVVSDTVLTALEFVELFLNARVLRVEEPVFDDFAIVVTALAVVDVHLGSGGGRRNRVLLSSHLQQRGQRSAGVHLRHIGVTRFQLVVGNMPQLGVAFRVVNNLQKVIVAGLLGPRFKTRRRTRITRLFASIGAGLGFSVLFLVTPIEFARLVFRPHPRLGRVVVADVVLRFFKLFYHKISICKLIFGIQTGDASKASPVVTCSPI